MTSSGLSAYAQSVDGANQMSLALERILSPVFGHPVEGGEQEERLNIAVIFTSADSTVAALKRAGALASSLGARIVLLATQVVPFPLPLDSPPVLIDWNENRFRAIAGESPVETVVRLYLCRDRIETLKAALSPKSVVVIGGRKKRWPFTAEKTIARQLRRAGHEVIITETE
jgi:hypothetical protein